jgi:hypothetical protein
MDRLRASARCPGARPLQRGHATARRAPGDPSRAWRFQRARTSPSAWADSPWSWATTKARSTRVPLANARKAAFGQARLRNSLLGRPEERVTHLRKGGLRCRRGVEPARWLARRARPPTSPGGSQEDSSLFRTNRRRCAGPAPRARRHRLRTPRREARTEGSRSATGGGPSSPGHVSQAAWRSSLSKPRGMGPAGRWKR